MANTESANRALNLQVLRRGDPQTEDIMCSAAHVAAYDFDESAGAWRRKDIEGTLFVVKRTGRPRFRLVVMNRVDPRKNLVEDLDDPDVEFEVSLPYLMYRNRDGAVNGIWFYAENECNSVADLLRKIVASLGAGGGAAGGGVGADFVGDRQGDSRGGSPVALTLEQVEAGTMARAGSGGDGDGISSMAEEVERERQQRQKAKKDKQQAAGGKKGTAANGGGTPPDEKGAVAAAAEDDASGAASIMELLGIRGSDRQPPVSNSAHQQAQKQYQMQMAQMAQQQQQQQAPQQQTLSPMELMAQLNVGGGSRGSSPQPAVLQPVVKAAQPPPSKAAQKPPPAKAEPTPPRSPAIVPEDDHSIMSLFSTQIAQAPPQATPVAARRAPSPPQQVVGVHPPSQQQQPPPPLHHAHQQQAPAALPHHHQQPHAVAQPVAAPVVVPPSYSEGSVRRALLALVNDDDFVSMIHKALEKAAGKS